MATNSKRHGLQTMHTAGIFSDMTVDGPKIGILMVTVNRAKNLPDRKLIGKQNPYCAARLGKEAKRTETDHRGGQTPKWDQELHYTVHDSPDYYQLTVSVFNEDKRTDLIGETRIDLKGIITPGGGQNALWHNLRCKGKYAGEVLAEITYTDTRPGQRKKEKTKQTPSVNVVPTSTFYLPQNTLNQQPPEPHAYTPSEHTDQEYVAARRRLIKTQDQASRGRDYCQIPAKNYSCSRNEKSSFKSPQLFASKHTLKAQNAMSPSSIDVIPEISTAASNFLSQQYLDGQHDTLERRPQKKSQCATFNRDQKNSPNIKKYIPYEIPSIENLGILPDLGESPPPPPIHGSNRSHLHNNFDRAPAYVPIPALNPDLDSVSNSQSRDSSYKQKSTTSTQLHSQSYDRRGSQIPNIVTQNQSNYQSSRVVN